MLVLDVNVLVYAFDVASPSHPTCATWLEHAGNANQLMGVSSQVMTAVVRISTNPAIFARPARTEHVLDFLEDVRNLPAFFAAEPGPAHWSLFTKLILQHQLQKASLTDGWLAALSLELGASVVTTDSGFNRFRDLSVVNPLRAG